MFATKVVAHATVKWIVLSVDYFHFYDIMNYGFGPWNEIVSTHFEASALSMTLSVTDYLKLCNAIYFLIIHLIVYQHMLNW